MYQVVSSNMNIGESKTLLFIINKESYCTVSVTVNNRDTYFALKSVLKLPSLPNFGTPPLEWLICHVNPFKARFLSGVRDLDAETRENKWLNPVWKVSLCTCNQI